MGDGLSNRESADDAITVRLATDDDSWFLYQLRNEPDVREASFDDTPLAWERHIEWLESRRNDGSLIYVVDSPNGDTAGYVRFHPTDEEGEFEVAVAVVPDMRGRGVATEAIRAASTAAESEGATRLVARIKPGNDASIRAFEASGYSGALRLNGDASEVVLARTALK